MRFKVYVHVLYWYIQHWLLATSLLSVISNPCRSCL